MRWLVPLVFFLIGPSIPAQKTAADSLKEADGLNRAGDRVGARRVLEQTIDLAVQEKDPRLEADARYYLGAALNQAAQYEASVVQLRAALSLYEQFGNRSQQADAYSELGLAAWASGKPEEARSNFEKVVGAVYGLGEMGKSRRPAL